MFTAAGLSAMHEGLKWYDEDERAHKRARDVGLLVV